MTQSSGLIVVRAFSPPHEAHLACSALQAAGTPARLADDHIVGANWLYSNAVDGIKVLVPVDDAAAAEAALATPAEVETAASVADGSYGLPAFRLAGRPLVCFGAATHHCSFHPMSPAVIRAHAADLKRYETSKETIGFPVDRPLLPALVPKLVKARIAEIELTRTPPKGRLQPAKTRRSTAERQPASRGALSRARRER